MKLSKFLSLLLSSILLVGCGGPNYNNTYDIDAPDPNATRVFAPGITEDDLSDSSQADTDGTESSTTETNTNKSSTADTGDTEPNTQPSDEVRINFSRQATTSYTKMCSSTRRIARETARTTISMICMSISRIL